ncbi:hypothetical protein NIES2100_05460 [Calothrix sp. NIES-2100]|uniref:DUF1565 domain-containing protein n=1 Tax=Calothrix sp. NIES-2100 TaxID=1954172 RepID=UPI000B60080C|nr:hypothetical protein NIES2100_05460 [Calothrix sp. NIES-2100]
MPLIDGFIGTSGTDLSGRTAYNGSTWTRTRNDGDNTNSKLIISPSGRVRQWKKINASNFSVHANSTQVNTTNFYEVLGIFKWYGDPDLISSSRSSIGFGLRYLNSSNSGYAATIRYSEATGSTKLFAIYNLQSNQYPKQSGTNESRCPLVTGHSYAIIIQAVSGAINAGVFSLTTGKWLSGGLFDTISNTLVVSSKVINPNITQVGTPAIFAIFDPATNPADDVSYSTIQFHGAVSDVLSEVPKLTVVSAPQQGLSGQASTNFTLGYTGILAPGKNYTIVPSDSGAGGVFTPSTFNISTTNTTVSFTYKPPLLNPTDPPQEIPLSFTADGVLLTQSNYTSYSSNTNITDDGTNPTFEYVGYTSPNFRVTINGVNLPTTVNLSDNSNGVFTPNTLTFTYPGQELTFKYRPNSLGDITLFITGNNFTTKTYNFQGLTPTVDIKSSPNVAWLNYASKTFTVGLNGGVSQLAGSIPLTFNSSGGTFTPANVTLTGANPTATFTFTPNTTGNKTITISSIYAISATKNIFVGLKPTKITLTLPSKNNCEISQYSEAFNISVDGLVIDNIEVLVTDNNKNSIIPKIIFSNPDQIPNPVNSKDFIIKVCNSEAFILTAISPGLTSNSVSFTGILDTTNYDRSFIFNDDFERGNTTSLGNGWLHGSQYSLVDGKVVTTNKTLSDVITFFRGQVVRTTVRCFLDEESFTLTSAELNAFHKVIVGDTVLGNKQIPTSTTVTAKASNNSLTLSKKPTDSNPKDCLRGISIVNSEIECEIQPPLSYLWNQIHTARIISRKQENKDAKYFVDISAENKGSTMVVIASLFTKISTREKPDRIYVRKVYLQNTAHTFRFTTITYDSTTVLELRAINPNNGITTFIFRVVNGEPELQKPGDIGISHNGVATFNSFSYYSITTKKKNSPLNFYVDINNGNDNNNGSYSAPFQNISKALSKYEKGRNLIIVIRPGTYNTTYTEENPLILRDGCSIVGESTAPVIKASVLIDQSSDSSLNNLIFDGNNYQIKKAVTIRDAYNFIFKNIEIYGYRETALDIQRVSEAEFSDFKITDSSYSSLILGYIPSFSTDKQTSVILFGFLFKTIFRDFYINTLDSRGGQAFLAWSEHWERLNNYL